MQRWMSWALLATVMLVGPANAGVDLEHYLKQDGYLNIKISPDGRHFAATFPIEDRVGLAILRRADKKLVARALGGKDSAVDNFWWADDERVVIGMAQRLGNRDEPYRTDELVGLGVDGQVRRLLSQTNADVGLVDRAGDTSAQMEFATFAAEAPPATAGQKKPRAGRGVSSGVGRIRRAGRPMPGRPSGPGSARS